MGKAWQQPSARHVAAHVQAREHPRPVLRAPVPAPEAAGVTACPSYSLGAAAALMWLQPLSASGCQPLREPFLPATASRAP